MTNNPGKITMLRRYTPPTCTLEIKGQDSALSPIAGQPVAKEVEFELHFDDPREPDEKKITIRGDREQLEALHEAVRIYVQSLLIQSPEQIATGIEAISTPISSAPRLIDDAQSDPIIHSEAPTINLQASVEKTEPIETTPAPDQDSSSSLLDWSMSLHQKAQADQPPSLEPYLQPKSLLKHDLFLGSLATEASGAVVTMSALQLFDLATALDEYASEIVALPTLNPPFWNRVPIPRWASMAAMLVLGVGVTGAMFKVLDQAGTNSKPTEPQAVSVVPSPGTEVNPPSALPPIPPSPPGSLLPVQPFPTPAAVPTPSARLSVPPSNVPQGTLVAPQRLPTPLTAPPAPSGVGTLREPQPRFTPMTRLPSDSRATVAMEPNFQTQPQPENPQPGSPANPPLRILQLPSAPPLVSSRPQPNQVAVAPTSKSGSNQTIPESEQSLASAATSTAPDNIVGLQPPSPRRSALPDTTASTLSLPNTGESATDTTNTARGTGFDTNPAVTEVKDYFQKRWQPPAGLTQTLEYILVVNTDGTIERIMPLGQAAATYIDRTNMPSPGQPFISRVGGESNPQIRVVLSPDGKVQTFSEATK